ncbi:mechanosensitive ion channel domain-containing protein [Thiomicrorhabdus heinhorstiae]|uniref:Mechanosensitive ion channel n=1 Tax=Thiomicrorhabdus heinhorstiae TaxID=2748010 RepID=A0ABS0BZS8_9GAMM|nr:mechanosensitive ion channel domain-containing protein [Thiomicrorhabdus heinhorstiae]MBF6057602.1 mechanosensitive ion channel [Thiomicrorhabdus heinhorstiae]
MAADNTSPKASESWVESQTVDTLSQELKQADQLSDDQKQSLSSQLDNANNWIIESRQSQQTLLQLEQSLAKAAITIKEQQEAQKTLQNRLKNPPEEAPVELNALISALHTANDELDEADSNLLNWDSTLNQYLSMATDGANQQNQMESIITQLKEGAEKIQTEGASDLNLAIQNLALKARLQALETSLQLINFQMDNLGRLTELAQVQRDYWATRKALAQKNSEQLQVQLQTLKTAEAEQALKETIATGIGAQNPLYPVQQNIISQQKEKADLIRLEQQIGQKINASNDAIATIKLHFSRDKQIVALQGSRETIAQVLHKRLETLTAFEVSQREISRTKDRINEAVLNQLLLSEKLRELQQRTTEELLIEQLGPSGYQLSLDSEGKPGKIALDLINQYVQSAKDLQNLYPGYISKLAELNATYNQQLEQVNSYSRFLNDHLLWLPNIGLIDLLKAQNLQDSLNWLLSFDKIAALSKDSYQVAANYLPQIILWLLILVALLLGRRRFIAAQSHLALQLASIRTDAFRYSLQALTYTLLLALPLPWFMLVAGKLLSLSDQAHDFTTGVSNGLLDAGLLVLVLNILKEVCRKDGLAERHFHWKESVRSSLQRELRWAIPLGALLILAVDVTTDSSGPADTQLIGRIAFLGLMIAFTLLIYRLWSGKSLIMRDFKNSQQHAAWLQLHFIWFPLSLMFPLLMIWSTAYGYYYSSLVVADKINWTLATVLSLYLIRELFLRSLYLSERKQLYAEHLQKRQAQLAQQKENAPASELPIPEEPEMDYEKLSKQVRQALNLSFILAFIAAAWMTWGDLISALNLINDTPLSITKSQIIDGVVQQVPLTLGDLIIGIALGAMTLLLSKDLPGLLEYLLLQHLPISRAARYAITSLTQYLIAIIGFVVIFRSLGIEWSNIQWLVAALSVGLGFGLQEIVANFVSGIILLFEQPMRVGDIVTVDDVTGKVSKIRIRATTIVTWDRQELVIPNKQIITGKFINWSLSDSVTRIKIDVGIAYGSDVNLAQKLIKETATSHHLVLKEPEPSVIFDGFGDSALLLSLRAYIDDLEKLLQTRSELNNAINDTLNRAGIVIAFPQQDVHFDTTQPLEIHLNRKPAGKTSDNKEN